ncbi:hypothetical protein Goari_019757 [Gossypium aridum]|uniref:RNase H type-1 domain-containing protein n=1 Tax=Gossypium aridum TaxID=34290 RepID=A0A7J8WTL6_GOSAI|nr:hypothetical protein [Gossypium aridum]
MGLNSVTIMGDSKTIINKCRMTVRDKSILGAIIEDIQSNKSRFQKIIFRFIQRTENLEAHNLAKDALRKVEERYLVGETMEESALEDEMKRQKIAKKENFLENAVLRTDLMLLK